MGNIPVAEYRRLSRKAPPRASRAYEPPEDMSLFGAYREEPGVLAVCVPLPPSVNEMYRSVNGRTVKSAVGRGYERCVEALLRRSPALRGHVPFWAPGEPLEARFRWFFPDRRRRDWDNPIKACQDSVFRALGLDDSRVYTAAVDKLLDSERPRAEVLIRPAYNHPWLLKDHKDQPIIRYGEDGLARWESS